MGHKGDCLLPETFNYTTKINKNWRKFLSTKIYFFKIPTRYIVKFRVLKFVFQATITKIFREDPQDPKYHLSVPFHPPKTWSWVHHWLSYYNHSLHLGEIKNTFVCSTVFTIILINKVFFLQNPVFVNRPLLIKTRAEMVFTDSCFLTGVKYNEKRFK